jgi:hypothetical protein
MADADAGDQVETPAEGRESVKGDQPDVQTLGSAGVKSEEVNSGNSTVAQSLQKNGDALKQEDDENTSAESKDEGVKGKPADAAIATPSRHQDFKKPYQPNNRKRKFESQNVFDPASLPDTDDPDAIRKQVCCPPSIYTQEVVF